MKIVKPKPKFPIIGVEYRYLGTPVTVRRVVPCLGGPVVDAHIEFETRFGEGSDCRYVELDDWLKPDHVFTQRQLDTRLEYQERALRESLSDEETKFVKKQIRDTKKLLKELNVKSPTIRPKSAS